MRDYAKEFENRVAFIRDLLKSSGAKGVIYGNSGGKDSALVGILCKAACDNTVGIMMPCASKRNFGEDMTDGLAVAEQFNIETRTVDLTAEKELVMQTVSAVTTLNQMATSNIAPRLRMLTLYPIGAAEGRLVAGTGNRSEEARDRERSELRPDGADAVRLDRRLVVAQRDQDAPGAAVADSPHRSDGQEHHDQRHVVDRRG